MKTILFPHSDSSKASRRLFGIAGGLALVVLVFLALFLRRGGEAEKESLFRHLSDHQVGELTFELDLDAVYDKDSLDFAGALNWVEEGGARYSLPVSVSIRGNNRREVCDFPPLKIEVPEGKDQAFGAGCYKVVSHCLTGGDPSLLMREYLAFQLYEDLTPNSFQSHLMRVTYVDIDGGQAPVESWMLLLESKEDLLARLDAREIDPEEEPLAEISGPDYHRFAVFQYMIGNTDWNLDNGHNVKWVEPRSGGLPIPVPYDFDRSGIVDAPYAEPHSMLPIQTVRERYFQWRGHDRKQLEPVLADFRLQKERLLGEVWELDQLPIHERQEVALYLEDFFRYMDQLLTEGVRTAGAWAVGKDRAG